MTVGVAWYAHFACGLLAIPQVEGLLVTGLSSTASLGDRIFIDNLRLKCRVGVTDEERLLPQEILMDITLAINLKPAGTSDNLGDTLDYKDMLRRISQFASEREFKLLEGLAEGIAALALKVDRVEKVTVKARKAKYSSEPSIGVKIERSS
ncbi:MAG: dihydroneopterin aldolase [Nitrososphaerota archaeon]|nr:dihydroneopterin aldolase [Nitrososphaerota archaeon]MDG6950998.1 dihydroneopterin aldolase [Nitrososphaerota archaeon]